LTDKVFTEMKQSLEIKPVQTFMATTFK